MSETSGFFISQGGDRKYTPAWLASYIKALVTTGVYKDELAVTAGDGMAIYLPYGRAWLEGYLYLNDAPMTMAIDNADSVLGRKDSVVVRLNMTARTITTVVLPGTFSASPVAPAITRNADIYDLKLAEINIPAGTTKITQNLILDTRLDDTVCGLTVCTVQHIPTGTFLARMTADFETWFEAVRGQLDKDPAGHLLLLIEALQEEVEGNYRELDEAMETLKKNLEEATKISDETETAIWGETGSHTIDQALAQLRTLITTAQSTADLKARFELNSYYGTGQYGEAHPTELSFSFPPRVVMLFDSVGKILTQIRMASSDIANTIIGYTGVLTTEYKNGVFLPAGRSDGGSLLYAKASSDGKTIYIYSTAYEENQFNRTKVYYYAGIG